MHYCRRTVFQHSSSAVFLLVLMFTLSCPHASLSQVKGVGGPQKNSRIRCDEVIVEVESKPQASSVSVSSVGCLHMVVDRGFMDSMMQVIMGIVRSLQPLQQPPQLSAPPSTSSVVVHIPHILGEWRIPSRGAGAIIPIEMRGIEVRVASWGRPQLTNVDVIVPSLHVKDLGTASNISVRVEKREIVTSVSVGASSINAVFTHRHLFWDFVDDQACIMWQPFGFAPIVVSTPYGRGNLLSGIPTHSKRRQLGLPGDGESPTDDDAHSPCPDNGTCRVEFPWSTGILDASQCDFVFSTRVNVRVECASVSFVPVDNPQARIGIESPCIAVSVDTEPKCTHVNVVCKSLIACRHMDGEMVERNILEAADVSVGVDVHQARFIPSTTNSTEVNIHSSRLDITGSSLALRDVLMMIPATFPPPKPRLDALPDDSLNPVTCVNLRFDVANIAVMPLCLKATPFVLSVTQAPCSPTRVSIALAQAQCIATDHEVTMLNTESLNVDVETWASGHTGVSVCSVGKLDMNLYAEPLRCFVQNVVLDTPFEAIGHYTAAPICGPLLWRPPSIFTTRVSVSFEHGASITLRNSKDLNIAALQCKSVLFSMHQRGGAAYCSSCVTQIDVSMSLSSISARGNTIVTNVSSRSRGHPIQVSVTVPSDDGPTIVNCDVRGLGIIGRVPRLMEFISDVTQFANDFNVVAHPTPVYTGSRATHFGVPYAGLVEKNQHNMFPSAVSRNIVCIQLCVSDLIVMMPAGSIGWAGIVPQIDACDVHMSSDGSVSVSSGVSLSILLTQIGHVNLAAGSMLNMHNTRPNPSADPRLTATQSVAREQFHSLGDDDVDGKQSPVLKKTLTSGDASWSRTQTHVIAAPICTSVCVSVSDKGELASLSVVLDSDADIVLHKDRVDLMVSVVDEILSGFLTEADPAASDVTIAAPNVDASSNAGNRQSVPNIHVYFHGKLCISLQPIDVAFIASPVLDVTPVFCLSEGMALGSSVMNVMARFELVQNDNAMATANLATLDEVNVGIHLSEFSTKVTCACKRFVVGVFLEPYLDVAMWVYGCGVAASTLKARLSGFSSGTSHPSSGSESACMDTRMTAPKVDTPASDQKETNVSVNLGACHLVWEIPTGETIDVGLQLRCSVCLIGHHVVVDSKLTRTTATFGDEGMENFGVMFDMPELVFAYSNALSSVHASNTMRLVFATSDIDMNASVTEVAVLCASVQQLVSVVSGHEILQQSSRGEFSLVLSRR